MLLVLVIIVLEEIISMSGRNLLPPTYGRLEGGGNRFMKIMFGATAEVNHGFGEGEVEADNYSSHSQSFIFG